MLRKMKITPLSTEKKIESTLNFIAKVNVNFYSIFVFQFIYIRSFKIYLLDPNVVIELVVVTDNLLLSVNTITFYLLYLPLLWLN